MENRIIHEWFDLYADDVYSFLVRYTGSYDVEDMLQETFLKAMRGLHNFRGRSSPRTWLFSIAKSVAADHFRKRKREMSYAGETALSGLRSPDASPDDVAELHDLQQVVHQAIQSLKPDYRSVLILRGISELSIVETAEILGWSESRVRVTFHRALKALQKQLKKPEYGGVGAWVQ